MDQIEKQMSKEIPSADLANSYLHGRHAVITGAAGAIGQAIASALEQAGARLTLIDIRPDFDDQKLKTNGEHRLVTVDLSNDRETDEMCTKVLATTPVDILINCVGILNSEKSFDTTTDLWRQVMTVNVDSMLKTAQACAPSMIDSGWGRIINIGSLAWKTGGITAGTAYSTSKAAVVGLSKSLAREYAIHGITVNVIAPAYVMSPMVSEQLSAAERDNVNKMIPVGRFCRPEEVAHVAAFLAHDLAGFITGEVIDVTGGLSLG